MIKNILIVALLLLLGFGLYHKFLSFEFLTETKTVIKTEIEHDTIVLKQAVLIKEPTVIYRDKYQPYKLPSSNVNPISNQRDSFEVILPVHQYQDTLYQDSSKFAYNIVVDGYLKSFDYDFTSYQRKVTRTVTNEKIRDRLFNVFAVGGFSDNPQIGVDIVTKKYKVGYKYSIPLNTSSVSHQIDFGYSIFRY